MKRILLLFLTSLFVASTEAKKIKFAVDMSSEVVNEAGIHLAGDFQTAIGLPKNWLWDATKLSKEKNDTNIYSIVLDLPAFKKYEFLFVNGQFDYEQEFVSLESRVGFNFVSNRWLYLDSLSNDTTFVGAIKFSGNAPSGYNLLRFKVNMQEISATPAAGVHVAGSFQGFDPQKTILYSFDKKIYEIITYVKSGTYSYKYYNGNKSENAETVPTACAKNEYRSIEVNDHTVLEAVCFASCENCKTISINESQIIETVNFYPNPVKEGIWINDLSSNSTIKINDISGRTIWTGTNESNNYFIDCQHLNEGIFLLTIENKVSNSFKTSKFIKL